MVVGHSINAEIIALWKETKFEDESVVLWPLLYPLLQKDSILFVGLNPSFSLRGYNYILKEKPKFSEFKPYEFYDWRISGKFNIDEALEIEKIAKNDYHYFNKFNEIAKATGLNWEHIDLFFCRETSQENFKKIIYDGKSLNDFGNRQLNLSKKLIIDTNPKVIVVANALASALFQGLFPDIKFNDIYGYHTISINQRTVPVFLASMLTGQRAMDNNSYRRLSWHIRKSISDF